eukprot:TRINITY_DN60760_c0_g1_i1.p1 TRINITY_DN60760_c0_g1~~TRINITY_DN60760_c0_g1_i1.p1  ORF type:complete len:126 (-),score=11.73 TRINITY_DN60760_c0_g1_i1:272-649(-)
MALQEPVTCSRSRTPVSIGLYALLFSDDASMSQSHFTHGHVKECRQGTLHSGQFDSPQKGYGNFASEEVRFVPGSQGEEGERRSDTTTAKSKENRKPKVITFSSAQEALNNLHMLSSQDSVVHSI